LPAKANEHAVLMAADALKICLQMRQSRYIINYVCGVGLLKVKLIGLIAADSISEENAK
jgi:hypothetical protein